MHRFLQLTAAFIAALILLATPLAAADKGGKAKTMAAPTVSQPASYAAAPDPAPEWVPSWSGIFIGANAGAQFALGDLSLNQGGTSLGSINSLGSEHGFQENLIGGFDLGATWRIKNSPFVLIAMAGYQWGDTDFNVTFGGTNVLNPLVTQMALMQAGVDPGLAGMGTAETFARLGIVPNEGDELARIRQLQAHMANARGDYGGAP